MISPDIDSISWTHFIFACVVVGGLLALSGFIMKYVRSGSIATPLARGSRRLQITETFAIDMRRRLVIVRCDQAEHLLLLGLNQDIVIATNLEKTPPRPFETKV